MNGVVPDEGRRTLLARLAALVSLVPGVDGATSEPRFDAWADVSSEDERDGGSGSGIDSDARDAQTAVVDRVEDGTAVVLFEDAGYQRTVAAAVLPEAAREEGTVLRVPEGEALALATVDRTATRERRESAQGRVDDLVERPDGT